ncbi:MAG: hypothetical protein HZA63_06680 [Rhodocyclales bacterium]|nr:hypothetical protein [Rhodocyclales bacterium]
MATGRMPDFGGQLAPKPGGRVVQFRWNYGDAGDASRYQRLRAVLAANTPNPWLRTLISQSGEPRPGSIEAVIGLLATDQAGAFGTVLDFVEIDDHRAVDTADAGELTFDEWLREFHPVGRDDFLMALPLYHLYRDTGALLPTIQAIPDQWLDAVLANTRGMLFWTAQWIEVIRVAGNVGGQEALQLLRAYQLGQSDTQAVLEQLRYFATGQSLMQIINERSPTGASFGSPDYLAGDWLHQHWS